MLKEDFDIYMNKARASKIIGLSRVALTEIMNRKVACRKVTAFCITKFIDKDAEIEDYFEKVR